MIGQEGDVISIAINADDDATAEAALQLDNGELQ
jgi:hypothetical protein